MRFQSGRLEDQRSTMPLEAAARSTSHRRTTDEEEPPVPPPASTHPPASSKDGLVSRLVKGRKWARVVGTRRHFIDLILLTHALRLYARVGLFWCRSSMYEIYLELLMLLIVLKAPAPHHHPPATWLFSWMIFALGGVPKQPFLSHVPSVKIMQ